MHVGVKQEISFKLAGSLCLIVAFVLFFCDNVNSQALKIINIEKYRQLRSEKLNQQRRVIYNNDGNDVIREAEPVDTLYHMYPAQKEFSVSTFLDVRTTPLKGSDVSTIAYCTLASGFGQFTHNTKVGNFYQSDSNKLFPISPSYRIQTVIPGFVKKNTDPLEVVCEYAHKNGFEVFWSNRMNDTHDNGWDSLSKPPPLWTKFKAQHPEYLFGKIGEKMPYGAWSAVDFARPEIRNLAVQFFTEVCENYDVDGIELDFFRHLHLFKNVAKGDTASSVEINMITGMIARIREMTERVGMKKGKPILVVIKVPDSFGYCRGIGIDLQKWMKEGLVDIVVGSCYFRLNPYEYLVAEGHKYNVKVYPGLSESRVKKEHPLLRRMTNPVYRARSAAALQAGVDGTYIYNEYNPKAKYLSEIGGAEKLKTKNKLYFVTDVDPVPGRWNSPGGYLKNGEKYYNLTLLTPEIPINLHSRHLALLLEIGDESLPARVSLAIYTSGLDAKTMKVSLNGHFLKYKKSDDKGLSVFDVPFNAVRRGHNKLKFTYNARENEAKQKQENMPGPNLLDAALLFFRDPGDQDTKDLAAFCFDN
ncbi:MAG: hypothetical protein ABI416_06285 [Ginsengibacter sp.]